MKRTIALLLIALMALSAVAFAGCSGNSDSAGTNVVELSYESIGELKASGKDFAFLKADRRLSDDDLVCTIGDDCEGDIEIPGEFNDKKVVAVVSKSPTNEKIESLTLLMGVLYAENVFNSSSSIKKLDFSDGFKGVYNSFNGAKELTEVSFPSTTQYIVGSFCSDAKLAKAETKGYLYGITDSFLKDDALADVTIGGAVQKLTNSFNGSGVTEVKFVGNIHDIIESFNECPALKSVTTEQIAGDISKSFCKCPALTDVTFAQSLSGADKSFNDNEALQNVDFGTGAGNLAESFENCPKYTLPAPEGE